MVNVKKYPKAIKLAAVKRLRSKVDKQLDMDLPPTHELHRMLNMNPRKSAKVQEELDEINVALEKKATKEEVEEFESRERALDSLQDLEIELAKMKKEEDEAVKVRAIEEEWERARREEKYKVSPEELKVYEAALDEYAEKIGRMASKDARELGKGLKKLEDDIKSGKLSDEEKEARIEGWVKRARQIQKKRLKKVAE